MLIAVEVLNNKSRYNTIELTSGRMAEVKKGDVVVGALGHRKALFGYSGHLPTELKPGDIVQLLNLGGVIGICDSINPSHGEPFNCKVLGLRARLPVLGPTRRRAGARLDRAAEARRAARHARRARRRDRGHLHELRQDRRRVRDREPLPPQRPRRRRVQVDGRRAAPRHPRDGRLGRAPHRDVLRLRHLRDDVEERAGAHALAAERAVATQKPDAIVFELGDGLLGAYGVEAILRDKEIVDEDHGDGAVRERSRRRVGRREVAARGVRHRADGDLGPGHRQSGRHRHHPASARTSRR